MERIVERLATYWKKKFANHISNKRLAKYIKNAQNSVIREQTIQLKTGKNLNGPFTKEDI